MYKNFSAILARKMPISTRLKAVGTALKKTFTKPFPRSSKAISDFKETVKSRQGNSRLRHGILILLSLVRAVSLTCALIFSPLYAILLIAWFEYWLRKEDVGEESIQHVGQWGLLVDASLTIVGAIILRERKGSSKRSKDALGTDDGEARTGSKDAVDTAVADFGGNSDSIRLLNTSTAYAGSDNQDMISPTTKEPRNTTIDLRVPQAVADLLSSSLGPRTPSPIPQDGAVGRSYGEGYGLALMVFTL